MGAFFVFRIRKVSPVLPFSCEAPGAGRRRAFVLAGLALAALVSTACKTVRAETPVEHPNLEVPPPPARVIDPVVIEPTLPEPIEAAVNPATPVKPRPQTTAPPRPELKPEPPVEAPAPAPAPPPAAPPPELRTPGMASGPEASRQIRTTLDRTASLLRGTNYQALSGERKNSYDTAMRFQQEGERELKAANYVLAKEWADKAERLAKELQGRGK